MKVTARSDNYSCARVSLWLSFSRSLQVYDGYFVHYFAPRGLPVVPKDVIFVIDVSGSMIGTKIKQVKLRSVSLKYRFDFICVETMEVLI